MRGIGRASHSKKDGVKEDFFSLKALACCFLEAPNLVSRLRTFTVLNPNNVYYPVPLLTLSS